MEAMNITEPLTFDALMALLDTMRAKIGNNPKEVHINENTLTRILRSIYGDRTDCVTIAGIPITINNRLSDSIVVWVLP